MAKGNPLRDARKNSKKKTKHQDLSDRLDELEQRLSVAFHLAARDTEKINSLLVGLMDELNLIEKIDCDVDECDATVLLPKLKAVEPDPNCPKCGGILPLADKGQQKLEDWLDGSDEEE